jgi:ferritin-like metal-binding protein YciE
LGNAKAATLLQEILDQEKAANESLTELAESKSNSEAMEKPQENGFSSGKKSNRATATASR